MLHPRGIRTGLTYARISAKIIGSKERCESTWAKYEVASQLGDVAVFPNVLRVLERTILYSVGAPNKHAQSTQ